uniref:Protein phosphatase 1 regulatory subunit 35 C-terminal domain-containing protein n=1 Tax=Ceratitis capitata TaxID=7213 RepID=W8BTS5_CERCA
MPNCKSKNVVKNSKTLQKPACQKQDRMPSSSINCIKKGEIKEVPKSSSSKSRLQQIATVDNCINDKKYKTPQMNTILREKNQIESLKSIQPPIFKNDLDLTPRSKAIIAPKVTQRLNFNADEVIFKNLTPINVNDTILIQKQCNANPNKFKANKIPSPELCHWLNPLPPLKHTIPEPEITLEFCDIEIDPFDIYLRLLN